MEQQLRLSQKQRRVDDDSDRDIFEVIDFDRTDNKHIAEASGLLYEYYLTSYGEDYSEVTELTVLGKTVPIQKAEAELYRYLYEHCKIKLVRHTDEMIGIMIYNLIYDCVCVIRCIYIMPDHWGKGLGKKMVYDISSTVKKVLFQTTKKNPPIEMLKSTKSHSKLIHESEDLYCWEMPWERKS